MTTKQQTAEDTVVSLDATNPYEEQLRTKTLLQRATYRLSRDYLTLAAIAAIVLLTIMSFAAPLIVDLLDVNYNLNDPYMGKLSPQTTASESKTTLQQWSFEEGEWGYRRAFVGHIQPIGTIDFHPDQSLFMTTSQDQSIRIWTLVGGGTERKLDYTLDDEGQYTTAVFNPVGDKFATATSFGQIDTWETEKANKTDPDIALVTLAAHDGAINDIQYGADGLTLVSASDDGTAKLWDIESGTLLLTFELRSPVNGVAYSFDQTQIATADENGTLTLWDANSGETVYTIDIGTPLNGVFFNAENTQLLTSGGQTASLWDVESGEQITEIDYPTQVNQARFALEETIILAAGQDGAAYLWDIESGEFTDEFDNFTFPLLDAVASENGEMIVTASEGQRRNFIIGTDTAGRDQFTRLLYGGQVSLQVGFLSAIGTLTVGLLIGITAGFFGGWIDDIIMWVITTLDSIPGLYLLLLVSALVSTNENIPISDTAVLILVLVVLVWTGSTRIVRGETFALREREYVLAARALGASNFRIMFHHIAPNVISILLIVLTRLIGNLILTESALSFLGFGIKPPTPTWGNMLSSDLGLLRSAPHLVIAPGLMITITVLCLFIIGDGLRDAFDPTQSD